MTKAQQEFSGRVESKELPASDARDFLTWYHPDDMHRLAYSIYRTQPKETQDIFHAPVMVLGSGAHSFEDKMSFCRHLLEESDKSILPFMIAPEIGAAHFMAGFIRKNKDEAEQPELFLFNPTGYTKITAAKRLAIDDISDVALMKMHVSSAQIQTIAKDQLDGKEGGPALVSCGPISLMFIEYLLRNPGFALELDEHFALPESLVQLGSQGKEEYQQRIIAQRKAHYELLASIEDDELEQIDTIQYSFVHEFLEGDWLRAGSWENDTLYEDDLIFEYEIELEERRDKPTTDETRKQDLPPPKKVIDFQKEKENFDGLLAQLTLKTDELIRKGDPKSPNHRQYAKARLSAEKLIKQLGTFSEQFFSQEISAQSLELFRKNCTSEIAEASKEFQNHRGWWYSLNPILKGFLGFLAMLTFLPAVVIQATTKHGYSGTFFVPPPTDASDKLTEFAKNLDTLITTDLSIKVNS